jgi:hypothetical protein
VVESDIGKGPTLEMMGTGVKACGILKTP